MPVSLKDIRFQVHDVFDFAGHYAALAATPGFSGGEPPDRPFIDAVLDEIQRFADAELEPLNPVGDRTGCVLQDGVVTTPPGFKEAFATFAAGGWQGLTGDVKYGGQGLPDSLSLLIEDVVACANLAWSMYPALSRGVMLALAAHGSDPQRARFLPPLLSGECTGTMCLTEPQAGSDVGLARTRAEPQDDGSYAISGTKIFISAGDHDFTDDILHLVLARLPDAPEGTGGISLFVVPKRRDDGSANGVVCGGIEEKMGIHGNATCMLNFDQAAGYLVGEPNQGMRYMFTMMNGARLVVGLQGVAGAHAASLKSLQYARERLQMRALSGPVAPDQPADPIIAHGDVRRMLLTQRAIAEGGRALVYYAGLVADRAECGDADSRAAAGELLDLLTPIVKGGLTELGFESVNHALQIHGGHGYITETGVEQYVRDLRIALVYEGTTQIQALDLLGRKILQTRGAGLMRFLGEVGELATSLEQSFPSYARALNEVAAEWGELTLALGDKARTNLEEVSSAAVDYLFYASYCVLAYCWARMAQAAAAGKAAGDGDTDFLDGKLAVAEFYFARLLPRRVAHKAAMEAGAPTLMDPSADAIASL